VRLERDGVGGGGGLHDDVKDDGQRGHAGVDGHTLEAGAGGDGGIPLFGDGLAEAELDDEE